VTTPGAPLDLRAFACPLTYVKTRIALDRLESGEALEVLLADGEPAESVPRSAEEDGHRVVRLEPLGAAWRVVIEKGARAPGERPWP